MVINVENSWPWTHFLYQVNSVRLHLAERKALLMCKQTRTLLAALILIHQVSNQWDKVPWLHLKCIWNIRKHFLKGIFRKNTTGYTFSSPLQINFKDHSYESEETDESIRHFKHARSEKADTMHPLVLKKLEFG